LGSLQVGPFLMECGGLHGLEVAFGLGIERLGVGDGKALGCIAFLTGRFVVDHLFCSVAREETQLVQKIFNAVQTFEMLGLWICAVGRVTDNMNIAKESAHRLQFIVQQPDYGSQHCD